MRETGRILYDSTEVAIANGNPLPVRMVTAPNYETVAASQTDQVMGAAGAIGDILTRLSLSVAIAATAQVQIKDGGDAAITVFPNSPGGGVGSYTVELGLVSAAGAWKITTGAGVTVIASGTFT